MREVLEVLPTPSLEPAGSFTVLVNGEPLNIPARMYNPEPQAPALRAFTANHRAVLACLYTRHHDGYVRQRHLGTILGLLDAWIPPFVVQLIGEYVVEILHDIAEGLRELDVEGSEQRTQYGAFVVENPGFFELTAQRVISYWNAYYRYEPPYPDRANYPGFPLVSSLRGAAAELQPAETAI